MDRHDNSTIQKHIYCLISDVRIDWKNSGLCQFSLVENFLYVNFKYIVRTPRFLSVFHKLYAGTTDTRIPSPTRTDQGKVEILLTLWSIKVPLILGAPFGQPPRICSRIPQDCSPLMLYEDALEKPVVFMEMSKNGTVSAGRLAGIEVISRPSGLKAAGRPTVATSVYAPLFTAYNEAAAMLTSADSNCRQRRAG